MHQYLSSIKIRKSWTALALSALIGTQLLSTPGAGAAPRDPRSFPADAPLRQQPEERPSPILKDAKFYLSVGNIADNDEVAREYCTLLTESLTQGNRGAIQADCSKANRREEIAAARLSGEYRFHFSLIENLDGTLSLKIENWKKANREDFEQVAVRSVGPTREEREAVIRRRIYRFFDYLKSEPYFREAQVATCSRESTLYQVDESGKYVELATGRTITVEEARALCAKQSPRTKNFLVASTEIAVSLGLGAVGYWNTKEINQVDWETDNFVESLRRKFVTGKAIKFDTNIYALNAPGHPLAGAGYFIFARTSNYNALESFLFALAGSSLWEVIVEYREGLSINDMIVTPVAGSVIGEVAYQLGYFFDTGAPTITNKILGAIFGGSARLNQWILNNAPKRHQDTGKYGFRKDIWHEFQLYAAPEVMTGTQTEGSKTNIQLGLSTQIFKVPGHDQPGKASRWITDSVFTQLILQSSIGSQGLQDFQWLTQVAFAGYYKKSLEADPNGKLKGYSFFIGPSTAFDFRQRETGRFKDQVGVVNVLGSTMELVYYNNGVKIRALMDVFGDFGMIRSYAIDDYAQAQGMEGIKSVLREQKYYFAFGMTLAPKVEATYGRWGMGAGLKYQYFDSIEGWDRHQDLVTNDVNAVDSRQGYKVWVRYTLPGDVVSVALMVEQLRASGEVDQIRASDSQTRVSSQLIVKF